MSRHTYDCHVRFSDVDVYGHVNNVKYFEYFQEARIAFILSLDEPLFEPSRDSAMRQVVVRIDVDYKRPILFRPEPYAVVTWVTRIGTSSYDLACRILDGDGDGDGDGDDDETVYAQAEVRLVAFDTGTQRSRPLSDVERARLEAVLEG